MIIFLSLLSVSSISIALIMFFYTKYTVNNYVEVLKGLDIIEEKLNNYAIQLALVYNLEEFYGDEIIKKTIENTRTLEKEIRDYANSLYPEEENNEKES